MAIDRRPRAPLRGIHFGSRLDASPAARTIALLLLPVAVMFVVMGSATSVASAGQRDTPADPDDQPSAAERSSCGGADLPPFESDLKGAIADRLETLQEDQADEPGFLGVAYGGERYWIFVDQDAVARFQDGIAGTGVQVVAGCVSTELIDKTMRALEASPRRGSGDFSSVTYDVFTDSLNIVTTEPADQVRSRIAAVDPEASKLEAQGALRVTTAEAGAVQRLAGRLADTPPFFGGGRICTDTGACSTGFYIDSATRGTVMLTAGHCGVNGDPVLNGNEQLVVGLIEGRSFPNPDLAVIDGNTYAARSFSANDNSSSKAISNAVNPTTGVTYCQMGWVSRRVCSSYSSLNAQFCDEAGCTNGLAFTSRPCSSGPLGQEGDSGGGVFKEASGTLSARGVAIAAGPIGTGANCARYDHRLSTILAHYDAEVFIIP